MSIFR